MITETSRARAIGRSQNSAIGASSTAADTGDPALEDVIRAYVAELLDVAPALTPGQQREVRMLLGAGARIPIPRAA